MLCWFLFSYITEFQILPRVHPRSSKGAKGEPQMLNRYRTIHKIQTLTGIRQQMDRPTEKSLEDVKVQIEGFVNG